MQRYTARARDDLNQLVQIGNSLQECSGSIEDELECFVEEFQQSAWLWLSMACLGDRNVDQFRGTLDDVFERLRLKDLDRPAQLKRAKEEAEELNQQLKKRQKEVEQTKKQNQELAKDPEKIKEVEAGLSNKDADNNNN